jgi:hypothetical protein
VVSPTRRLRVLIVVVAIVFSFVGARAVQIQVFNGKAVAAQAATDMTVARSVPAVRGTITGRDGSVLALTEATVNVVADPKRISTNGKEASTMTQADRDKAASAPADMAAIIAPALGLDKAEVETKLRKTDSQYQLLAKQVAASTWSALNATLTERGFLGITRESNPSRVYPYGTVASNVVGFMSDGKGAAGLERSLDTTLTGTPGREIYETSPMGKIPLGNQVLTPAVDGTDVPAHPRPRPAMDGRAAARRTGQGGQRQLGRGDRHGCRDRRTAQHGQLPLLRLQQPRGRQRRGHRQPGGQRRLRARVGAEGADPGVAAGRGPDDPGHHVFDRRQHRRR